MKRRHFTALLILAAIAIVGITTLITGDSEPQIRTRSLGISSRSQMYQNGRFIISVFRGSRWEIAGAVACDRFLRDYSLQLKRVKEGDNLRIRIKKEGGGMAHLDSVILGGTAATGKKSTLIKKIGKKDLDVADIGRGLDLTFKNIKNPILKLRGRIESKRIGQIPFRFPVANQRLRPRTAKFFYSYKVVGNQTDINEKQQGLFKEYCTPISGHPNGFLYGWVGHDRRYLKVRLDFTSDNTRDGEKDYAKLYVKTAKGVRVFKITESCNKWGRSLFIYTDKVNYQHKVYEFKIPFTVLGFQDVRAASQVQLAVSVYGTASFGNYLPVLSYSTVSTSYLVAYWAATPTGEVIKGQLLNRDGSVQGSAFDISDGSASAYQTRPAISYDSVNNRYLVAWSQYYQGGNPKVCTQLVNAVTGGLVSTNFFVATNGGYHDALRAVYNPSVGCHVVFWKTVPSGSLEYIYSRRIDPDGSMSDSMRQMTHFSDASLSSAVVYNTTDNKYLLGYLYRTNTSYSVQLQQNNHDGSISGDGMTEVAVGGPYGSLDIAGYPSGNRYLVSWSTNLSLANSRVYHAVYTADGTVVGNSLLTSSWSAGCDQPALAFNSVENRFLSVMRFNGSSSDYHIYGQRINQDGSGYGGYFLISTNTNNTRFQDPSVASGAAQGGYLVAYSGYSPGSPDIYISAIADAFNVAPIAPVLLSPSNGSTLSNVDARFTWTASVDSDGDPVSYSVIVGTNAKLTGTTQTVQIASRSNSVPVAVAGMGLLVLLGFGMGGGLRKRSRMLALLLCLIFLFGFFLACSDDDVQTAATEAVLNSLTPGTTYYWKVVASDNQGNSSSSEVWSFSTP